MFNEFPQTSFAPGQQQRHQQQQQNMNHMCLQSAPSSQQIDPRQADFMAAELRRMQQAREEENNALMQLLSRQQHMAAGAMGSSPSPFNGNGMNLPSNSSAGNNTLFDSQRVNNFMLAQSLMNNFGMNMDGMDSMNNMKSDMITNQPPMSIININNVPTSAANAAAGNNPSCSIPQFEKVNLSNKNVFRESSPPMGNNFNPPSFVSNQDTNMNSMPQTFMNNNFFQKNQRMSSPANMDFQKNGDSNFQKNSDMDMRPPVAPSSNNNIQEAPANKQEDPGWEEQYKALRAYHLQFGHCKVPARFKANSKLGRWVMTQRRQFTLLMQGLASALTAERIRRLESLGFTWSVRPEPVTTWNQKFQELKAYKSTHGNCMVPQRYQANLPLGTWVHTQRRQYKLMNEGKKTSMTKEKIDALHSIGFNWDAKFVASSSKPAMIDKSD